MIPCLYTTQRSKKVKSWQDGYLQHHTDKKSVLFDYEQKVVTRFNLKELKEEINTGIYLITVDDINQADCFNKEYVQSETSPAEELNLQKESSKVKFEVPIMNNDGSIIKRQNSKPKTPLGNNIFEVIKIPTENKKRIINEEEAGLVIKKRINNTILCLREYMKLLDVKKPLDFAHKLSIEDLQKSLSEFLMKHEEFLLRNETTDEKREEECLLKEIRDFKTDEEIIEPVKEENTDTKPIKLSKEENTEGRTNNEIVNIIDD